jgi:hypothetical protein
MPEIESKFPDTRAFLGTLFEGDVEACGPVRGFIDRYDWGYSGHIGMGGETRDIARLHGRSFRLVTSAGLVLPVKIVSIELTPAANFSCIFRSREGVMAGSFDDLDLAGFERIEDPVDFGEGPKPAATYRLSMPDKLMAPHLHDPRSG